MASNVMRIDQDRCDLLDCLSVKSVIVKPTSLKTNDIWNKTKRKEREKKNRRKERKTKRHVLDIDSNRLNAMKSNIETFKTNFEESVGAYKLSADDVILPMDNESITKHTYDIQMRYCKLVEPQFY
ncbi:hypothetical protein V1478_002481, partial [Vespula squamosa]